MVTKKKTKTGLSSVVNSLVTNATLMRSELVSKLFDPRRDIEKEAGYPRTITAEMYRAMYDRDGTANRVTRFWPEESWTMNPEIFETEDPSKTPFEEAFEELNKRKHLFHYMQEIDVISGIGRYGLLLLGFDDGMELSEPMEGIPAAEDGEAPKKTTTPRKLLYLRLFSEESVEVSTVETDKENPRYGQPTHYELLLTTSSDDGTEAGLQTQNIERLRVHWSRVIHVAEKKEQSETYGTPRQKVVWNRLLDGQKVMGGAGEMFWKGAFPGYSIETNPNIPDVDLDTTTIRTQLSNYFNGLQRYLALTGVTVKSLTPQMGDPTSHRNAIMEDIAFAMGVPKRKLFGSEQAQLASEQDTRTWNGRVSRRCEMHVTPMIIRKVVDRLVWAGVLPVPPKGYEVFWPDLNAQTDMEKADIAAKRTEAFSKYVSGNVASLIAPEDYLTMIHGMDDEEVEQILDGMREHLEDMLDHQEQMQPQDPPQEAAAPPAGAVEA